MLFKHAQMGIMPKAKPLPIDPVEREKVLRQRRANVERVGRWRKCHPEAARIYTYAAQRRFLASKKAKAQLQALRMLT
jgi:hypothetical protein